MFHPQWRERAFAGLDQPFDLVVIGGGITGCGVLLDAAQRGLRVLLVEKNDLAAGTSSRSSKLLHGGLRYLANLQFRVTHHSCRERDRQVALNPHLTTLLDWIYPTYAGDETPGWKVELGLWLYDRMTENPNKHRKLAEAEIEALAPGLRDENRRRVLAYSDARVDDARLTHAVAATGFAHGGLVLTRAVVEEPRRGAGGALRGVVLRDLLDESTHEVEASLVINATGAWTDQVRERFGLEGRTVRPSRGSHLLFGHDRLPLRAAVTILSPDDRRPVFFIPHPEGIIAGTTDLFHEGDVDDPRPSRAEVDYILRTAAVGFPDDPPRAEDILGAFAGVRPVLANDSDDPSDASREEAIWHENGLLSVAGGKLTTWRSTAEEVVDEALELLPRERKRAATPCATEGTALGAVAPPDLDRRLAAVHGLRDEIAVALARRLGSVAWTACALAREGELRPLREGVDLTAAELRAHARFGATVHLSDALLRRVRVGMWRPEIARRLAPAAASILAGELGWDADRIDAELERFTRDLEAWTVGGIREDDPVAADVARVREGVNAAKGGEAGPRD